MALSQPGFLVNIAWQPKVAWLGSRPVAAQFCESVVRRPESRRRNKHGFLDRNDSVCKLQGTCRPRCGQQWPSHGQSIVKSSSSRSRYRHGTRGLVLDDREASVRVYLHLHEVCTLVRYLNEVSDCGLEGTAHNRVRYCAPRILKRQIQSLKLKVIVFRVSIKSSESLLLVKGPMGSQLGCADCVGKHHNNHPCNDLAPTGNVKPLSFYLEGGNSALSAIKFDATPLILKSLVDCLAPWILPTCFWSL